MLKKTNCMMISNRNQIKNKNIPLSGQPIARTPHDKFLDVFIGDKLEFDTHIDKLCSKVSKSIGVMRRISCGTNERFTKPVLYTHISKTHLFNHCLGISFQLYCSHSRITNIKSNIFSREKNKCQSVTNDS